MLSKLDHEFWGSTPGLSFRRRMAAVEIDLIVDWPR